MDMSFNIYRIFRLTAVMLAALLASCSRVDDVQPQDVGYLEFPVIGVDASVDNMLLTKALDFTVATPADLSGIVFVIYGSDGAEVERIEGAWTEPLTLKAGDYTVEASVGVDGFGDPYSSYVPYYVGRQTFTVSPLVGVRPSMTLGVGSSLVRITVADDMSGHFMPSGGGSWSSSSHVTLTSAAVEGDYTASYGKWAYVPSDAALTASLSGVNSVGREVSFTYSMPGNPAAAIAYSVVCGKDGAENWPAFTIAEQQNGAWANRLYVTPGVTQTGAVVPESMIVYEVSESSSDWSAAVVSRKVGDYHVVDGLVNGSTYYVRGKIGNIISSNAAQITVQPSLTADSPVSAGHYNDAGGNLAGTNAYFAGLGIDALADGHILRTLKKAGILKVTASLVNAAGDVVRTASSDDAAFMASVSGWPYLPQGSGYTLKFQHGLVGDSSVESSLAGPTVPAPSFAVTLKAGSFTSYDEYAETNGIAKNVGNANTRDPETLYNVSASWSISTDLMNNDNYAKSLKYSLNYLTDKVRDTAYSGSLKGVNSSSAVSISGLTDWTSYSLTAKLAFDGTEISSGARVHEITGLPYNVSPPKNSGSNQWNDKQGNNVWESDCVKLYYSNGKYPRIISPTFHVPGDMKVSVYTKIYREYYWASVAKGDIRVYQCNSSGGEENKLYKGELAREKTYEPSTPLSAVMTSVRPAFYIQYDYMASTGYTNVYYFKVHYSN